MESRAQASPSHKNRGKRRASEAQTHSPARSDASTGTIGAAFRARKAKRIKKERNGSLLPPSKVAHAVERSQTTVVKASENNQSFVLSESGLATPPTAQAPARKLTLGIKISECTLDTFSTRHPKSERYRRRADDALEDAFSTATPGFDDAEPGLASGLAYLEYVVERVHEHGRSESRAKELRRRLMEMWRLQMASYLGRNMACTAELQDAVNAIICALPPEFKVDGIFLSRMKEVLTANSISRTEDNVKTNDSKATSLPASEIRTNAFQSSSKQSEDNSRGLTSGTGYCSATRTPKSVPFEFSDDIVKEDVRSYGRTTVGLTPDRNELTNIDQKLGNCFSEPFSDPIDVFRFHLEKAVRCSAEQILYDLDDVTSFAGYAAALYSALETHEKDAWTRVYQQISRSELGLCDDTPAEDLLLRQDILSRFEKGLVKLAPPVASSAKFNLIPFVPRKTRETPCSVMFVLNTPDIQCRTDSADRVVRACTVAFGHSPHVEVCTEHIWIATFPNASQAKRAMGWPIQLNGRAVIAEEARDKAPDSFICDFTDIDVCQEEVAGQVAECFKGRPGRVKMEVLQAPKLHLGRVFKITVPKKQPLIRFYIPMRRTSDPDDLFMACFTPVDTDVPCSLCQDQHKGRRCEHSKRVPLPF